MASSDVIELGSSDEEQEPAPKKKKPTLNAMVHFPKEVPGLVIKPVKPAIPNLQKVLAGGAVTITNLKKGKLTTQISKAKTNGRSVQKFVHKSPLKMPMIRNVSITNPKGINNLSVNPLSLMKKHPMSRVQGQKLNLPPGITVKRTATTPNISNVTSSRRKQNLKRKQPVNIITTVELDDEEVPLTSVTGPQWYLRPEEQIDKVVNEKKDGGIKDEQINDVEKNVNMELENNTEPDTKCYIEITIEDSPIKPPHIMKGFEVGSELPITIEDSPTKPVKEQASASNSDVEKSNVTDRQSKKRLDYPKGVGVSGTTKAQHMVEVDLETVQSTEESKKTSLQNTDVDMVVETKNDSETSKDETHKKVPTMLVNKEIKDDEISNTPSTGLNIDNEEFHPIYQKFIDLCFELENSDDMRKIVEKKIKTYYRQCPKDYVESDEFIDMVSSKIFTMKATPDKMYLYIKDIVDELNLQRKSAKAMEILNKENEKSEDDKYCVAADGDYDSKRRRQIRKLDKTIRKLHRAIQKLEEQEVEFEDEEDSVYLLTERYKERLIRVHAKFCQLTNTKMPSEPRIHIEGRPGLPIGPAKKLEKWVNKKVPIGTPLPFPDFHDVLRCVRDANEEDKLGWNEADIMEEARDLFTRCGKKLQRRRQENEWRIAAARISHDVSTLDPAEKSDDLKKKLEENKTLAAKKETELLNKYADKQNQLKLVGEEIGDKEAEESPVESEDDEGNDESNSLENKQKRKERLKRLLHEKTKKLSSEKEDIANEVKFNNEENEVVVAEKMQCDVIPEETEGRKSNIQEIIHVTAVESNPITNTSEDGRISEQKVGRTNDSDLYDIDSDIDELHLLQKLYSENEINSSTQESDSDTPIAISDTLDSDSENENVKQQSEDIISIENSSYSESETTKDECEMTRASKEAKDKKIDSLLLQNAEIFLHSSSSRDKLNLEEENVLLASSEEERDVDTHLGVDKSKVSTCGIRLSNNGNANNCEVNLDNCDESSLKERRKPSDATFNQEESHKENKRILVNNFEHNTFNNNEGHFKLNEIMSQKRNIHLENESRNTTEKNQENINAVKCKSNVATNKDFSDDSTSVVRVYENDTESNCEIENHKFDDNDILSNNQGGTDSIKTKSTAINEINSKHNHNILEKYELSPRSIVIDGINERTSHSDEICTEEIIKCEESDVTVKIADDLSLKDQQTSCEDVELVASVQSKEKILA